MRLHMLAILSAAAFVGTMTLESPNADAVVYCAEGYYHAGCVVRPFVGAGVRSAARGTARRTTRRVVRRRSDIALKHDVFFLGRLQNGLGFYRFSYNGSDKVYVGVIAQEVQTVVPEAVTRGSDGYLRVAYDQLGLEFQTYGQWIAAGAHVPAGAPVWH
jgi:hypothetical protein